jgi:uncharacterized protein
MAWRRRGQYDPYDQYDPYGYDPYDPYDPRNRPRGGGYYQPQRGSSCLRDACLLDAGCCLGDAIAGNCLVLALFAAPRLFSALLGTVGSRTTVADRLIAAVRVYQREISAHRAACCRFSPTCSAYAVEALHTHGAARGLLLTLRRLLRCRPGGAVGHDPVAPPDRR